MPGRCSALLSAKDLMEYEETHGGTDIRVWEASEPMTAKPTTGERGGLRVKKGRVVCGEGL